MTETLASMVILLGIAAFCWILARVVDRLSRGPEVRISEQWLRELYRDRRD